MKIKLFLTFDHELPLGGLSVSYREALFDPTQRVMDVADKHGVKVTLFSDILCAHKYKDWNTDNFYSPYKEQLHYAVANGHDVQLHIHPHWLTTTYDGTRFHPSADFALSDFKDDTVFGGIPGIIRLSVDSLKVLCLPADKAYNCVAFRAGGYNIHKETDLIFNALYDNGIRYDSSMAKGYYFSSGISEVDFRHLPASPNWMVGPGILEIPIATIPKTPFEVPTRFKMKKYAGRAVENRGVMIHQDNRVDWRSKLRMLFAARMLSFDNHTLSPDYLLHIFRHTVRKYERDSDELMFSLISHPKSMGDYAFFLMESFISSVQKLYPETEFCTFSELYRQQRSTNK